MNYKTWRVLDVHTILMDDLFKEGKHKRGAMISRDIMKELIARNINPESLYGQYVQNKIHL